MAVSITTKNSVNLVYAIKQILLTKNIPYIIKADNELKNNNKMKALLKKYKIKLLVSLSYTL